MQQYIELGDPIKQAAHIKVEVENQYFKRSLNYCHLNQCIDLPMTNFI